MLSAENLRKYDGELNVEPPVERKGSRILGQWVTDSATMGLRRGGQEILRPSRPIAIPVSDAPTVLDSLVRREMQRQQVLNVRIAGHSSTFGRVAQEAITDSNARVFKFSLEVSETPIQEIMSAILAKFNTMQKKVQKRPWYKFGANVSDDYIFEVANSTKGEVDELMAGLSSRAYVISKLFNEPHLSSGKPGYITIMPGIDEAFTLANKTADEGKAEAEATEDVPKRQLILQTVNSLVAGMQILENDRAHMEVLRQRYLRMLASINSIELVYNCWRSELGQLLSNTGNNSLLEGFQTMSTSKVIEELSALQKK